MLTHQRHTHPRIVRLARLAAIAAYKEGRHYGRAQVSNGLETRVHSLARSFRFSTWRGILQGEIICNEWALRSSERASAGLQTALDKKEDGQ